MSKISSIKTFNSNVTIFLENGDSAMFHADDMLDFDYQINIESIAESLQIDWDDLQRCRKLILWVENHSKRGE